MAGPPVVMFPIIVTIRGIGIAIALLVLTWALHFRGGLALFSDDKDLIFNVHPAFMVIGLILINVEGMLAYKTISGTKNFKKLVHLTLQFLSFILSLIGVWAALKFHSDKGIENFYSLHSWLGLACLFLFSIQEWHRYSCVLLSFTKLRNKECENASNINCAAAVKR